MFIFLNSITLLTIAMILTQSMRLCSEHAILLIADFTYQADKVKILILILPIKNCQPLDVKETRYRCPDFYAVL
jgi:hypothetical protein